MDKQTYWLNRECMSVWLKKKANNGEVTKNKQSIFYTRIGNKCGKWGGKQEKTSKIDLIICRETVLGYRIRKEN